MAVWALLSMTLEHSEGIAKEERGAGVTQFMLKSRMPTPAD
jgi:hypothetical protein